MSVQVSRLLRTYATSVILLGGLLTGSLASAQESLPIDNGLVEYHTSPRWRESEGHPLRVFAYIVHPIGWVARELFLRPISYLAGSTPTTRSVFGYREPFDYRQPECFSASDISPDCRATSPFNYDQQMPEEEEVSTEAAVVATPSVIYFPNVNFDFAKGSLNALGKGRAKVVAQSLSQSGAVKVVLEGHTDYIGSETANERLGMNRAEAVKAELIAQGISADKLSTISFGEKKPLLDEKTDYARAVNRRVEVRVGE